jgi:hypothetical protein
MRNDKTVSHDGFAVGREFKIPPDSIDLDPKTKREVTICNLFVNHKLTIPEIVRVLEEDYGHVVNVLLGSGVVGDRRQKSPVTLQGVERRRSGKLARGVGQSTSIPFRKF